MEAKSKVLNLLDKKQISYEIMEHEAVFNMEDMEKCGITQKGGVCKNLFLRDAKGKTHFLVTVPEEYKVDLSKLGEKLGTKLSFASAERLSKYLGVEQGSVSPFGILNDNEHCVKVIFDKNMTHAARVGIHPNDNTATVWLSFKDLKKIIEEQGNEIMYI